MVKPLLGFESTVIERLSLNINAMPKGAATLRVGKHPRDVNSPFPYFEVIPRNTGSAPIRGFVSNTEGVNLTIGKAAWRELWIGGGEIFVSRSCEDEFVMICRAVFTTYFTEDAVMLHDKIVASKIDLKVEGKSVRFGHNFLIRWPFTGQKRVQFSYEPYL